MPTITPEPAALGAVVTDVDLRRPLAPETVAELRAALLRHEVLFFPEAGLTPLEQVQLGRSFGSLQVHAALDALADLPEVVVFDTARKATVAEWWHSDVSCAPEPPMAALLQMVIAPLAGGATHWASMTAAYDALDDDTKALVGLDAAESDALLQRLFDHATSPQFCVRHDWRSGDIAFWDNRVTQHRVDNDFGQARRCGHRIAIDGDAPF